MGIYRTNSSLDLKDMVSGDERKCQTLWECQEKKRHGARISNGVVVMRSRRSAGRRIAMKRRACVEAGYGNNAQSPVERKVRALKKLIPYREPMSLDGLFMQTANYILSLQMRVKVMQILVKVLTGCDEYLY